MFPNSEPVGVPHEFAGQERTPFLCGSEVNVFDASSQEFKKIKSG